MNAKAQAICDIEDNSEKMEKEKAKVNAYEASLVAEEKILKGICDSLKGMIFFDYKALRNMLVTENMEQATHDDIEGKQRSERCSVDIVLHRSVRQVRYNDDAK